MYTGNLWLDFESEEEEEHYAAEISGCIFRENELILEFSGSDEGHHFSGGCVLLKDGDDYAGEGSFNYEGKDKVSSRVVVTLKKDGYETSLRGTWKDQGEAEPYQFEAELNETKYKG